MATQEFHNTPDAEPVAESANDLIPMAMRLLRVIRYRKKVVFITLYCFALAGIVYYLLATRLYRSSAKLLIVEQKIDQLSAVGDHDSIGNTMATHRELVISPVVIEQAIQRLTPQHRVDLQGQPPRSWTSTIADGLSAKVTRKTNFIEVGYRSRNPEAAAAVVSAVIQSYLDFVEKNHKGAAGEILTVLTDERDQLQADLNQRQIELQQCRQQVGHLAISSTDGVVDPMIQRAIRLNEALLDVKEKRLELQTRLASIQDSLSRGEDISQLLIGVEDTLGKQMLLSSMGLTPQDLQVLSDQQKKLLAAQEQLQNLSADYGPNHPRITELQQQIQSLSQYLQSYHLGVGQRFDSIGGAVPGEMIVKMLKQSKRQAEQQEEQLLASFEQARAEASRHSDALVQLHMLERDVLRKESLYDSLSEKIASIDISQVQAPIKATVVREPLPNKMPVSPQLRLVVAFCLLGGTFAGGLIVYVQDVLDDRFNSPEELTAQLGVPVLAMVHHLEALPGEGLATVHTNTMPSAAETEAFRTLRTSLSLSGEECDRLLISSSEPGDGKTTISANLAVAFAQAGKRTLVIDADLRRPGFTALMNLKGQPGVADVLASDQPPEISAAPLIQQTVVDGLDILPVGLRRPNPAELLSGKAFVELLAWADSQYDRVIVDCPPVLAVSDAQIIGQLVDGAILVVQPEKNHRRSVMRAVESFQATGCRVLGVVANRLTNDSNGYGYGYGYGYSYGYGHHDEEEPEATLPISMTATLPRAPTDQVYEAPTNTAPVPNTIQQVASPQNMNSPTTIRPRRAG
ncbi:MAG: polysaccharide biosynthesis tyrosine autokinase [Pirellulales bacterium]|nr:polysaccharide biosynthesis tyrosine autokinase [Pirellulales bacterium]